MKKNLRHNLRHILVMAALSIFILSGGISYADITDRSTPAGTSVPNPGTQEQELANITAPAPYNVFEFVVTCAACHGGTIDQQAGHFGNWSGTNMASAIRDPVFRANQQIVNSTINSLIGEDGAGNICIRCHSPNAWYSGRTDPLLNGEADGSTLIHSILLSTDDEGILCEACHRTIGGVTMKRSDLNPTDPVWNMMSGISDWPHAGTAYPEGPIADNPYGDATLQINDGMTYIGKYSGSVDIYYSDIPMFGSYTGQTYGINPPGWPDAGLPVINPDGSIPIHFELPIGPPLNPDFTYNYEAQGLSLEHPTAGDRPSPLLPADVPPGNKFIRSPEFCGACHDLTVPILNHGMPEQRTYTEWKFSDYGDDLSPNYKRCQDCHMPTMKHEYADDAPVSVNPDPTLAGWFPYAKDRNSYGGTAFHKLVGANRDLPMMMSVLYPEVDLEVIGAPTGNDTRIFPGMLSGREIMWERAKRNTEISLLDAVDVEITSGPTETTPGVYEVAVTVTNNAGHRVPSGYPDGRRFWISLVVKDELENIVYESGFYDHATATLYDDQLSGTVDDRALSNIIDATVDNKVMIYEKRTGVCDNPPTSCTMSVSLLNDKILFDNRIPPSGFTYADYQVAGAKFISYDPGTLVPSETASRFTDNTDTVTYQFPAPTGAVLSARAEVYWQTHTREFMEHLKDNNTSMYRPEGPPNILDPNYPLTPTYLSDSFTQTTGIDFFTLTDIDGYPLNDNWGGIAYAAWMLTGMGEPYLVAADDMTLTGPPDAPTGLTVDTVPNDPFKLIVFWDPVDNADGYIVWIRFGISDATASWDKLAVVSAPTTELVNDGLNVGKTYGFKVQAFNGLGMSIDSAVVVKQTPVDLPLPPENLQVIGVTDTTVTLSWFDVADNEVGFVIERQDMPLLFGDPIPPFVEIARIPTPNNGGTGGVTFTDAGLAPGRTYNYRVAAYNVTGMSTYNVNGPVAAITTTSSPDAPSNLSAVASLVTNIPVVDLSWTDNSFNELGFRIERATAANFRRHLTTFTVTFDTTSFQDTSVQPDTTYYYRVIAYNDIGDSPPSNEVQVTTSVPVPAAPIDLNIIRSNRNSITIGWIDNSVNETGFIVERATIEVGPWTVIDQTKANATSYTDRTVLRGQTYFYKVKAFNTGGESDYSNVTSGTTQ